METPDSTELLIDKPDLERVWSATVTFRPPAEGGDIDGYIHSCLFGAGGRQSTGDRFALYDVGHVDILSTSPLTVRVACTTTNLIRLLRHELWRTLGVAHVNVDKLPESEEMGGEG